MMARLAAVRMTEERQRELEIIFAMMTNGAVADDRLAFRREDNKLHAEIETLADNSYITASSTKAIEMLARLRGEK
jgi:DNA-binding GntR family transcriptional regulator